MKMDFVPFAIFILFVITITTENNFISAASIPQIGNPQNAEYVTDSNERELENLKEKLDKTLEMVKTQTSEFTIRNNDQSESYVENKETVNSNGELMASVQQRVEAKTDKLNGSPMARIQTDVDIPSEGVHKSVLQEIEPRKLPAKNLKIKKTEESANNRENEVPITLPGVQYTPVDMAEYIFWTGDEKGVAAAIEEFINDGLMSRQEAILFLQETSKNLNFLESRYNQLGLNVQEKYNNNKPTVDFNVPKYNNPNIKYQRADQIPIVNNYYNRQQNMEMQRIKKEDRKALVVDELGNYDVTEEQKVNEYDQLLEKLKLADFLNTEYSLEDVIYQLAKIMFKQSLSRDSTEAQQALHKFITFLEKEAEQGHISQSLEKKVLDVLIAALTDTLNQNPDIMSKMKEGSQNIDSERQEVLQKIMELNTETNMNSPIFRYVTENQNKNLKYPSLTYGKYSSTT